MNVAKVGTQLFVIAVAVLAAGSIFAQEITAKVIGQRVNLRAKAAPTAEVVSQVSDGETLRVKSVGEQWVEIVPPDSVEFWVHRDLVSGNSIIGNRVNVRAGPGINYTVVGELERGSTIDTKGSFGEWVRIASFPEASLFISKDLVSISYADKPEPVLAPPASAPEAPPPSAGADAGPATDIASADEDVVVEDPALKADATSGSPNDLRLVPLEGQGRKAIKEGIVKPSPILLRKAGSHRLVEKQGVRLVSVCYLRGNTPQLQSFEEQRLRIHGREFWAQGFRDPILVVELIERLPAAEGAP